jgi:4-amino-4-deoxy-L-arabinose transferase-like glycosyltransferase
MSLAAACAFWWLCLHSDSIAFLPAERGAEWIVYPKPPEGGIRDAFPISAVFQHSFAVSTPPAKTVVTLRAFGKAAIAINGLAVPLPSPAKESWKSTVTTDVTGWLRAGTNVVSVWVTNTVGPPALWLRLQAGQQLLASDASWQVSLAGADWQPGRLATRPLEIAPGNPLYGAERTLDSAKRIWPVLAVLVVFSLGLVLLLERWSRRKRPDPAGKNIKPTQEKGVAQACLAAGSPGVAPNVRCNRWTYYLLAVVLIARVALFLHDLPLLPRSRGFDAGAHEDYVRFIQQQHALPLAKDGWEMYHPPLYYAAGALLLSAAGGSTADDSAILALKSINGLAGLIGCWLVLLCLRKLFPGNFQAQAAGLLVAAFLPPCLYLTQYVTNELLAAVLVTAAFYFCLRALETERFRFCLSLGVALGAALLTKFSAVLALPFFPVALGLRLLWRKQHAARDWLRTVGVILGSCLLVCGWHYGRVWAQSGEPIIGSWETASPFAQGQGPGSRASTFYSSALSPTALALSRQDPGFRTSTYYLGFGQALVSPSFSALHSFADGVYSTLWGDGLASGAARLTARAPWNYDLMNAGYLLALGPSLLFIVGLALALTRFLRQPGLPWFVVLGPLGLFGLGMFYMSLRVPSYAQGKAFYALPALLPFSAVTAVGWDWLARKHRLLRTSLWVLLLAWAFTVCTAFWIRPGNPEVPLGLGLYLADHQRNDEAAANLSLALELDQAARSYGQTPLLLCSRAEAQFNLALVMDRQGQTAEAVRHYRESLHVQPDFAGALNNLAWILATSPAADIRNGTEAVHLAERACALTRNQSTVCIGTLAAAYAETGRFADAIATAEKAIACANLRNELRLAARNQQLLELYRAGKPFHEARGHSQHATPPPPGSHLLSRGIRVGHLV